MKILKEYDLCPILLIITTLLVGILLGIYISLMFK